MNPKFVFVTLALLVTPSLAQTDFFVSPSGSDLQSGSESQPVQTINAAILKAQPGDRILVRQGVYREEVAFVRSGRAGAPITLSNYPGETAIISGAQRISDWESYSGQIYRSRLTFETRQVWQDTLIFLKPATRLSAMNAGSFYFESSSNLLYVWCTDGATPAKHLIEAGKRACGINLSLGEQETGCSFIEIRANRPGRLVVQHVMGTSESAFGIYLGYGSDYNVLSGAAPEHRNLLIRCVGRGWDPATNAYQGVQLRKNSQLDGAQYNIIQYTDISGCGDKGIQLWGANTRFNQVRYNDVHDNGVHGIVPNRDADENIIEWNRVWGHDGSAGKINEGGAGIKTDDASGNIFRYNLCWQNVFGLGVVGESRATKIYHNVSYLNFGENQQNGYGLVCKGLGCAETDIRNNVFMNNRTAQIYIDEEALRDTDHRLHANVCYGEAEFAQAAVIRLGNMTQSSEEWNENPDWDGEILEVNPEFQDAENFNFFPENSSPLIDAGDDLGLPFSGKAPDIGVFETQLDTISAEIRLAPVSPVGLETLVIQVIFSKPIAQRPVLLLYSTDRQQFPLNPTGTLPGTQFEAHFEISRQLADGWCSVRIEQSELTLATGIPASLDCAPVDFRIDLPPLEPLGVKMEP